MSIGPVALPLGDAGDQPRPKAVVSRRRPEVGGAWMATTGYMVHVWNVPGYESPDGMFTELNRLITCPDGTYHRIPTRELGTKDTVCRSG